MKQPIRITIDPLCSLAYVEYRDFEKEGDITLRVLREPDGRVEEYGWSDGRVDEGTGVHADLNADDEIVGIEIIDIDDPESVAIARDYARDNDLAFPDDIRAAAASRDPAA
ncbi:MAG TPA: hypothetical protein VN224_12310 [Xanthomonadales bacterium]|nr:hypothetical protein [Xanthomonadales bacterium]